MLTRLLILWLLSETPSHGYRIKRILDDEALRFWFAVDYGSVYAVLRTLEREGLVRQGAVEREGSRPARRRYEITKEGRATLEELLREAWVRLPVPGEPIDLALAARSDLPEHEIGPLLERRAHGLCERIRLLRTLARSAPAPELVPRQLALAEAELKWIESIGDEGKEREAMQHPTEVQIIASLVVRRTDGRILLVRYQHDDERWWLPGEDLEPYEHPDEAARRILGALSGLRAAEPAFSHYESFRGRRGWHVVFHYLVDVDGEVVVDDPSDWFDPTDLPRTMHGRWERENVERALREANTGTPVTG